MTVFKDFSGPSDHEAIGGILLCVVRVTAVAVVALVDDSSMVLYSLVWSRFEASKLPLSLLSDQVHGGQGQLLHWMDEGSPLACGGAGNPDAFVAARSLLERGDIPQKN